MKRIIAIASALLLSAFASGAATYCVGPAATGTGTGADWNNVKAWSSTPARGDTWYLKNGSYAAKNFSVANSGSTLITIKKATVAEHGTDTGWSAAYAAQAVITAPLTVSSDYYLIDGLTRNENEWFLS